jgi:hypothetical protein
MGSEGRKRRKEHSNRTEGRTEGRTDGRKEEQDGRWDQKEGRE